MSQEKSRQNIDVVRAALDAFVTGEIEVVAKLYQPEACITAVPEGWPEPAPIEGRDAVMRQFIRLQEDWESHSMEIERQAAERDWVVIDIRWDTRGSGSGIPLTTNVTGAYRLEGGKIAEARFYWRFDDALQALGLSGLQVTQPPISRARLVEELARVSHEVWLLQGIRDYGRDPAKLPKEVTDHDRERAEQTVRRLEELGIVSWTK